MLVQTISFSSLYSGDEPLWPWAAHDRRIGQPFHIGDSIPAAEIPWLVVDGSLFCQWNLLTAISLDELSGMKLVADPCLVVDGFPFLLRLPFGMRAGKKGKVEFDQALEALDAAGLDGHWAATYSWCAEMRSGNTWTARGWDRPAEVLSFPRDERQACSWRPVLEPVRASGGGKPCAGEELFFWSRTSCVRGVLRDLTPYDVILDAQIGDWEPADGLFRRMPDGCVAVDRTQIWLVQRKQERPGR